MKDLIDEAVKKGYITSREGEKWFRSKLKKKKKQQQPTFIQTPQFPEFTPYNIVSNRPPNYNAIWNSYKF